MTPWVCLGCGCRYAAGAPRCPECPETAHEEAEVPNITSAGVFYEPGHEPEGWVSPVEGDAGPEPAAEPEAEAEPEVPAAPPAAPPRRTPPTEM